MPPVYAAGHYKRCGQGGFRADNAITAGEGEGLAKELTVMSEQ